MGEARRRERVIDAWERRLAGARPRSAASRGKLAGMWDKADATHAHAIYPERAPVQRWKLKVTFWSQALPTSGLGRIFSRLAPLEHPQLAAVTGVSD